MATLAEGQNREVGMWRGTDTVLEVRGLRKHFTIRGSAFRRQTLHVLNGVNFSLARGETFGLVGESGCGKTTVGRCIVRLLRPDEGSILYNGQNTAAMSAAEFWPLRRRIQMVFQDPTDALNPRMMVEETVSEPLLLHANLSADERLARVVELLDLVGLNAEHLGRYPHQLSIGQQQRVGIARAIATNPELLILDEPTSALDVSVRGMVLNLLTGLRERLGLTIIFISHDLSVVQHLCDRVAVMYLGTVVEIGPTAAIFSHPKHPYTEALLSAIPIPDPSAPRRRIVLPGEVPSPLNLPGGCLFHTRCPHRREECSGLRQILREHRPDHWVACHVRVP